MRLPWGESLEDVDYHRQHVGEGGEAARPFAAQAHEKMTMKGD